MASEPDELRADERAVDLPKLHDHLYRALDAIDLLCRIEKIPYFLLGGSALGAVRHQGIIPWDDDLDIGILRADYDRFVHAAGQSFGDAYFAQTFVSDPEYFLPYAKIRVNGTVFVEETARLADIHHGVFVDIFPVDTTVASRGGRARHFAAAKFSRTLVLARSSFRHPRGTSRLKRAIYAVLSVLLRPIPLVVLQRHVDNVFAKYKTRTPSFLVNLAGSHGAAKECFPPDVFGEGALTPFGGRQVRVPRLHDQYLTQLYGDYMTPPPSGQRAPRHRPVEISL